jgi:hypothetical protein
MSPQRGNPMSDMQGMQKLYDELAEWWPLMSAPADYADEAEFYGRTLRDACAAPPRTMLELGSGGVTTRRISRGASR